MKISFYILEKSRVSKYKYIHVHFQIALLNEMDVMQGEKVGFLNILRFKEFAKKFAQTHRQEKVLL
jgi:hypothetical protein